MSRFLIDLVREAYQSALANGHAFVGWTLDEIARDMLAYDADVAALNPPTCDLVAALARVI